MNEHIVLTVNGIVVYESAIGTKPPVDPTPTPVPIPAPPEPPKPPRSTVNYSLYMGLTRSQAEWQQLDKRVPGWSWEEFEASGFMEEDALYSGNSGNATTGFELVTNGRPLTNHLTAGITYEYRIPTQQGERVIVKLLEVTGTPDTMYPESTVVGPTGALVSAPRTSSPRGTAHDFLSPGGVLRLYVTPNVTAPLGVVRN